MKVLTKNIEIKNLTFKYPNLKNNIFNNFNLSFYKGDFTCILGHNGSGKSALVKIIAGLEQKYQGEVFVFNKLATQETLYDIRKDLCIVFQNPDNQFVGVTVEDDIAFGLENHFFNPKDMESIILSSLKKLRIEKLLKFPPHELSGGQKQKVAIAGVIALKPKIIIFDEATSMLDEKNKDEIFDIMLELNKKEKMSIIAITHNIELAKRADRIIVLEKGQVKADAKPIELFYNKTKMEELKITPPFVVDFVNNLIDAQIIKQKSLDLDEVLSWI